MSRNPGHFKILGFFSCLGSYKIGKIGGLPLLLQAIQVDRHLLHILHDCRHQCLLPDVTESAQTAIAKPMELFSIREASLNRFFSFAVQLLARLAEPVIPDPIFTVLPNVPGYHLPVISGLCTLIQ